jgi:hypothetical protein
MGSHEPKSPKMCWKRVRLSGDVYDLVVVRLDWTHWYWMGFVLLNDHELKFGSRQRNRLEAMEDAYSMANMHAGIQGDYPERYWTRWQRLPVPSLESMLSKQERLDRKRGRDRTRLQ